MHPLKQAMKNNLLLLVFAAFSIILLTHIIQTSTRYIKGDGYEYLLMTESLANHFSPNATLSDVHAIYNKMKKYSAHNPADETIFISYMRMLENHANESYGYFKSKDNRYYSYHFWLYSLVNVSALYLTDIFHLSPVKSFLITNIAIFILTLLFLLHYTPLTVKERVFIASFYLFSGTTYYMDWSHPEVFSASFLLIGLLLLLKNRFILAAIALAVPAQQNPPISVIVIGIIGWQLLLAIKDIFFSSFRVQDGMRLIISIVSLFCVLALSPLFYYIHFGVPNLIVSVGAASNHLISFDRLFSLFFDLNQGMIVAIPIAFLLLLIGFFTIIFQSTQFKNKQWRNNIMWAGIMLAIAILLAIPALTTGNWNSGQSIFMRYAYWIAMPIGLAVMLSLNLYKHRTFILLFVLFFLGQTYFLLTYTISGRDDTVECKWLANYLINNKPDWYNPIPSVFVKRTSNHSNAEDKTKIYYYVNKKNSITKILYHSINAATTIPFCNNMTIHQMINTKKAVATDENWFYLNNPDTLCKISLPNGLYTFQPHPI